MPRTFNTDKNGGSWSEETKRAVWRKGNTIPGFDLDIWRRDKCGKNIKYEDYGNRGSDYGWEIDHILAVANGGNDEFINLQPLHWSNNASKGDSLKWGRP